MKTIALLTLTLALTVNSACGGSPTPQQSTTSTSTSSSSSTTTPVSKSQRLLAYYPSGAKSATPPYSAQQIPYAKLTHIIHAFLLLDTSGNGNVVTPADLLEPALITKAHAAGVKVMISVGGGDSAQGAAFSTMAANSASRSAFVQNLTSFVKTNAYDGVDIDWEVPNAPTDTANCTALMQALRQALASPYLISMAVPSNPTNWGTGLDIPTLAQYVDFFNVMTYDFHGPWSSHSGHNSPLYLNPADPGQEGSLKTSIDLFLNQFGVQAAKLNIGTAFYGYEFDGVSDLWQFCPANDCSMTTNAQTYGTYIKPLITSKQWVAWIDAVAKAPYLVSSSGTGFITYDDATSTTAKVQYVLQTRQLGGVFMWSLNQDYDGSSQDLLNAMSAAYQTYGK